LIACAEHCHQRRRRQPDKSKPAQNKARDTRLS
jgi:hypothetical protein